MASRAWSERREAAFIARMAGRESAPDIARMTGREGAPDSEDVAAFRRLVRDFHRDHGRHDMAWRATRDPYAILVSEVMLQQTQVSRVEPKYAEFLAAFPTVAALAAAPLADVLRVWSGLGYNRRAVALKRLAEVVVADRGGALPTTAAELVRLPGVGPATAAAVAAFASGEARPYIETNIRAVYLHLFFADRIDVADRELMPLVERTLDRRDPRTWYYALLDYGAALKRRTTNPSRRSRHHARQATFAGSDRQLRGALVRELIAGGGSSARSLAASDLAAAIGADEARVRDVLGRMERDGLVVRDPAGRYAVEGADAGGSSRGAAGADRDAACGARDDRTGL